LPTREQIRRQLLKVCRSTGATVIYVTHDQLEAMVMGDTIALLAAGQLQQSGSPTTVYRHPNNLFAARFLGALPINLWREHWWGTNQLVFLRRKVGACSWSSRWLPVFAHIATNRSCWGSGRRKSVSRRVGSPPRDWRPASRLWKTSVLTSACNCGSAANRCWPDSPGMSAAVGGRRPRAPGPQVAPVF